MHLLGEPGRSITEVALAVGYQTPQALARAFRALLQVSPSSLRQAPAIRAQTLQQLATPALAPHAAPSMTWTVALAASPPGPSVQA